MMKATVRRLFRERPQRPVTIFASLRVRNYRVYACGAVVSNIGTWMHRVGQDWLVWQLTESAAAVGFATMAQLLPALLVSYPGGVIADRFDRRTLLLLYQINMAVPSMLIGILAIVGVLSPPVLFALILWFGCATAVESPVRHAFVAELVPNALLPNAVGLNSASFNSAQLIGPALGGLLIAALGSGVDAAGWVILANCLSFAVAALALWRLDRSLFVDRTPGRGDGPAGTDAVREPRSDIAAVLLLLLAVGVFGLVFRANNVLMVTITFASGATVFGLLASLLAVGALCGAVFSARRQAVTVRYLSGVACALGATNVAAAAAPTVGVYAGLLPVLGFLAQSSTNPGIALVQVLVSDARRGRAAALAMMCMMGGTAVSAPIFGLVAQLSSPRVSLLAGGVGVVAGAVSVLVWVCLQRRR
jgi:MFS family permease